MGPTTTSIAAAARRLGFDACGVAPSDPYPDQQRYFDWLKAGHHGEMAWLARDPLRRTDPRRVLEAARSLVVVFMSHYPGPLPPMPRDVPRGRIARYALGLDYHDVVTARLRLLAKELDDPEACCYVDTGPVVERSAALAAGLGWVGKNANFIVPGAGSYGFLGVIITTRDLATTKPPPISCGSCTACLPSCPTNAILGPGRIDARLCISYLTIELKGIIPAELRPRMGDWVFGCDDCQEPCPWNDKAKETAEAAFRPIADRLYPRLDALVTMTQAEFSTRFKGSPIKRAKRAGLARNAAVALGNTGNPEAIPPLRLALGHDEPNVRLHAAWALGRLGDREGLFRALRQDQNPAVKAELERALCRG